MNRLQLVRFTGLFFIFVVVASNIPYLILIQTFAYDDILREPLEVVLTKFQGGGTPLILTWFGFGLSALLFIPASLLLHQVLTLCPPNQNPLSLRLGTALGMLSGVLQAIGLMRWVFVIPILADLYLNPLTTATTREAIEVVYLAVHQYGGVILGEHLGQALLVGWTLSIGWAMRSSPLFKAWVPWWGWFTAPLLLLGQSELLATVIPGMPVLETTPIGFILWEVWLLILGLSLLRVSPLRVSPKR